MSRHQVPTTTSHPRVRLDFYCAELRLAVEVDGPIHETQQQAEYDAFRDRALADQGITTIRITNSALSRFRLTSLIDEFLKARSPSPPRGEGDRG